MTLNYFKNERGNIFRRFGSHPDCIGAEPPEHSLIVTVMGSGLLPFDKLRINFALAVILKYF
jgi:hypothetical protein